MLTRHLRVTPPPSLVLPLSLFLSIFLSIYLSPSHSPLSFLPPLSIIPSSLSPPIISHIVHGWYYPPLPDEHLVATWVITQNKRNNRNDVLMLVRFSRTGGSVLRQSDSL